jgi:CBS domain-containing protein
MKTRIATILDRKGHDVISIEASATVYEAIERMESRRVGSIIVLVDGAVAGIFTERDYLRRVTLQGRSSKTTPVSEVMTADIVCVDADFTVQECLAIMSEKKFRHLPVMKDEELVGIVSIGDLVKEISTQAQARVRYLEEYISGKYPA